MNRERIAALLERYWQAETTVEEEKELAEYFRREAVPPEWEEYREIFSFFEGEAQITPAHDLGGRIMQQVRPRFRMGWSAAAAAVLILAIGVFLMYQPSAPSAPVIAAKQRFKDTYDDPQQALAAVRSALFTASEKMNKGLRPLK